MILRYFALAVALALGLVTSQLPEFSQQYRQRLGGAIDELARVLAAFDADALRLNLTREEGIARMKTNADELVRQQGAHMQENSARLVRLRQQLIEYASAGPLARVGVMLGNFDQDVARRAMDDFEPAVPLTSEGAITTAAGAVAGWGLVRLVFLPLVLRRRRRAAKQGVRV
ncbi:MAG: hypothetical protein BGP04_17650 [Rhizobiales bacterium 62-17]|nr:DUF2937 family protein [Hyphomicrobiales bacterium]OJY03541.1 MAG: hypothetical protein BGP04_17650 [Rhizobiales bacterium 62-17]